MKRALFSLFSLFFALTLCAENHLDFLGIPIDGKPRKFISQLKKQGFELDKTYNQFDNLQRLYGAVDDKLCQVHVLSLNREVCKVTLAYVPSSSWENTYRFYKSLQMSYTVKYGTPDDYEIRDTKTSPTFDSIFQNIKDEEAYYRCYYKTEQGMVGLSIKSDDGATGYVEVRYEDRVNFYQQERRIM